MPEIDQYISEFWDLYHPPIPVDVQSQWLANTQKFYDFYRAFVPFFYKIIADSKNQYLQTLKQLETHKGWVIGDPHPANFGAIFTHSKKQPVIYSVNDADDGFGNSSLYIDLLRFLTGVKIIGKSSTKKILKTYIQTINKKATDNIPELINKHLKRLTQMQKRISKGKMKRVYNIMKHKAYASIQELDTKQRKQIQSTLRESLNDKGLKIKQGFKYLRTKGGSGGLYRKVLLVRFSDRSIPYRINHSKWLIMELKQLRKPSNQYSKRLSSEKIKQAKQDSLHWQANDRLSKLYQIVYLTDTDQYWLLRPRWIGNPVLDPQNLKSNQQRNKLFQYQAQLLANLHRKKAINFSAYIDDLKKINIKNWQKSANHMTKTLKTIWKTQQKYRLKEP